MFSVDAIWEDAADDARNLAWARGIWSEISSAYSTGRCYLNFAGLGEEGESLVRNSYGAPNYERLQALKARYDPGNMFRFNQNIVPASGGRRGCARAPR